MTQLLERGVKRLEWARTHMPVLARVREELKDGKALQGMKISMALHVEAKTGVLALSLKEAGAKVRLASCNPLSTDDSVAMALNEKYGLETFAKKGETNEEYYQNLNSILDLHPDILIDDGTDAIGMVHTSRQDVMEGILGANEETTTGIVRLQAMAREGVLKFPVMDVNNADMKHLFDNRYGTGQSTFDGIMNATNLQISGKKFVVAGYGWCGRGIAMRARGMGARVAVTEIDPVKAVEARMDGFDVLPMSEAVGGADFIVTATGCKDIVDSRHFSALKDGCVMCNAGHFNNEIDEVGLAKAASKENVRDFVERYTFPDGKKVYLLAEGRLVNLSAGQGHPVEIMDMSFAIQALCAQYVAQNHSSLKPGVYKVPDDIDKKVAWLELETHGVNIDQLTAEQEKYLNSWQEGT
ncbi:MAG: adenosylhomocysteinase [Candidatus Thermoplasmatota archaeon]|nr:adenosylhomocysteinase [Candidatus Thermoplasmatota archaeon]